ncbi:MAG: hypothetical protein IPP36_10925 [Nitrosomonadales bacterium]|nr:hypothetical protein [Nitrosomonadales bacterium]
MTSFNNNLIRPSNRIGLHPQLVHYDVQAYGGNNIGTNKINSIAPGWVKVYQWYAGVLDVAPSENICYSENVDAQIKLTKLSAPANQPNLRPLSELMTLEAFQEGALSTLVDGRKFHTENQKAKFEDMLKNISNIALDAGCIEITNEKQHVRNLACRHTTYGRCKRKGRLCSTCWKCRYRRRFLEDEAPL